MPIIRILSFSQRGDAITSKFTLARVRPGVWIRAVNKEQGYGDLAVAPRCSSRTHGSVRRGFLDSPCSVCCLSGRGPAPPRQVDELNRARPSTGLGLGGLLGGKQGRRSRPAAEERDGRLGEDVCTVPVGSQKLPASTVLGVVQGVFFVGF